MKTILPVFILFLFVRLCRADDINLDAYFIEGNHGKVVYLYNVSKSRLDSQPGWKPGVQPIPLSMDKAMQIAQAWEQKQSWAKYFEGWNQITLKKEEDSWVYVLDFDMRNNGRRLNPKRLMVLLDGTLIEPKRTDPNDPVLAQHSFDFDQ